MFIFYDIETTGTNIVYDQILQFGAILADDNLAEIERFEIRCRLLPWIIPAPGALRVTKTPLSQLEDRLLPDFFAMMAAIKERLANWGPAIFIGYNSMRFDEPFLQRAFWQALLPPYLTVTGAIRGSTSYRSSARPPISGPVSSKIRCGRMVRRAFALKASHRQMALIRTERMTRWATSRRRFS